LSTQEDIEQLARAFIAEAFSALEREHVIPTPVYHPYVSVGRDYYGDTLRGVEGYRPLEKALERAYPARFAEPLKRRHSEFAAHYIFALLEACVARCGLEDSFQTDGTPVAESISELIATLDSDTYEVVCIRHVSNLSTPSLEEVALGQVTVIPERSDRESLEMRVQREIPGAAQTWNREEPRPYAPPHSLLVTRERTADLDVEAVASSLSARLSQFMLVTRLLTASTAHFNYELIGSTTRVARLAPRFGQWRQGLLGLPLRRTARFGRELEPAFAALGERLDRLDRGPEGTIATSFEVALSMFSRSYRNGSEYEHIVDLATGLEAALIGQKSTESVTFRLRNRSAALLATDADPAGVIFKDVGLLYELRSKLVHGGRLHEREIAKLMRGISTVHNGEGWLFTLASSAERLRDLLRRAILARLMLAEPEVIWALDEDSGVDAALSDDQLRAEWRKAWHMRLDAIEAGFAAERARPAVSSISQDDQ
jgi:Apea-like HEPN